MSRQMLQLQFQCRTCLSEQSELNSLADNNLVSILQECTSIQVGATEPKRICGNCKRILLEFHSFKQRCLEADAIINQCLLTDGAIECVVKLESESDYKIEKENFQNSEDESFKVPGDSEEVTGKDKDAKTKSKWECHICVYCTKVFPDQYMLKIHKKMDHKQFSTLPKVNCPYCKKTFNGVVAFSKHVPNHKKRKPTLTCSDCALEFHAPEQLENHRVNSHSQVLCSVCNKMMKGGYTGLQRHLIVHARKLFSKNCGVMKGTHEKDEKVVFDLKENREIIFNLKESAEQILGKREKCPHCPKLFSGRARIKRHINALHLDRRKYCCDHCEKTFVEANQLNNHIKLKHRSTPHIECKKCDKKFYLLKMLERHMSTIHFDPTCKMCGKTFQDKRRFTRHQRTVHASTFNKWHCKECNKNYRTNQSLKKHQLVQHEGVDLRRICNICGTKCMDITGHMTEIHGIHSREYKCSTCGPALTPIFTSRKLYRKHYREKHGAIVKRKPTHVYRCTSCPRVFHTVEGLENHRKKPCTDNLETFCNICHKVFKHSNLRTHMRLHGDEKMYACEFCPKSFHFGYLLARHRRIHTGETPYRCETCDIAFVHYNSFAAHRKQHQKN